MILEALSRKERNELKNEDFGIPSLRKYPLIDIQHVNSAISYFGKCDEEHKLELAKNILKAVKKFNMEITTTTKFYSYIKDNPKISQSEIKAIPIHESMVTINEFVDIPDVSRWNSLTDRPLVIYCHKDRVEIFSYELKDGVCIYSDGEYNTNLSIPTDTECTLVLVNFEKSDVNVFMNRFKEEGIDRDILRDMIAVYNGHETVPFIVMLINYFGYFVNEEHAMVLCKHNMLIDTITKVYAKDHNTYLDSRCIKSFDMINFKDVKDFGSLLYNDIYEIPLVPKHIEYLQAVIVETIKLHRDKSCDVKIHPKLKLLYDKFVKGARYINSYPILTVFFKHRRITCKETWFK